MSGKRYLLDTHCLIWFQENNPKTPKQVLNIIQEPENIILFSQISLFEISIKQKIGKLHSQITTQEMYHQGIKDGFTFVDIRNQHIYKYDHIPFMEHHRDPFDRLLIATAMVEDAIILSNDSNFKLYHSIKVLW